MLPSKLNGVLMEYKSKTKFGFLIDKPKILSVDIS